MTTKIKRHWRGILIALIVLAIPVVAIAGDAFSGHGAQRDALEGPVVYTRPYGWNGTTWEAKGAAPVFAGGVPGNCVAITAGSVQFTIAASTYYEICAVGNSAYVLMGTNPTATTTVTTGYDFIVPEGVCLRPTQYSAAKAAVIGATAAGVLCFKAYSAM